MRPVIALDLPPRLGQPGVWRSDGTDSHPELCPAVAEWCRRSLKPGWGFTARKFGGLFQSTTIPVMQFVDHSDLLAFRLRWL